MDNTPDKELKIGFAMTGSFCTFKKAIDALYELKKLYPDITPVMSETAAFTDTRFGKAEDFRNEIESICQKKIITNITGAEPIGPKKLFDALVIAPCTGNTIAKIAAGVTDSSVTMAAKAHLRNERPLVIAPSTNDGLGANAKNLGILLNTKNIYFVPFGQDDPFKKHRSLVADFSKITSALAEALEEKQYQPILL